MQGHFGTNRNSFLHRYRNLSFYHDRNSPQKQACTYRNSAKFHSFSWFFLVASSCSEHIGVGPPLCNISSDINHSLGLNLRLKGGGKKKEREEKKRVTRPNFVVVELIFGSHVNMLVAFEWVIHINYSHHYATGEKGGTKREKREKKFSFFDLQALQRPDKKLCEGQTRLNLNILCPRAYFYQKSPLDGGNFMSNFCCFPVKEVFSPKCLPKYGYF